MSEQLGPKSPAAKQLRRLFSSRRDRREEKSFAVEGPELIAAALAAGWSVHSLFVEASAFHTPAIAEVLATARHRGVAIAELRDGVLAQVADAVTPQPLAAIISMRLLDLDALEVAPLILVADRVSDPGNLGALVRVAEASGAAGLVLTGSCADPFGPKALRASAGSALRLPIVEVPDLPGALGVLRASGYVVAATTPHGARDFTKVEWPERVALVLGSEAHGLDAMTLAGAELRVGIPMAHGPESLNLAVSAGILSMAIVRRLTSQEDGLRGPTMNPMPESETR